MYGTVMGDAIPGFCTVGVASQKMVKSEKRNPKQILNPKTSNLGDMKLATTRRRDPPQRRVADVSFGI
jgi:hypothetical protein